MSDILLCRLLTFERFIVVSSSGWSSPLGLLDCEDDSTTVLPNVRNYLTTQYHVPEDLNLHQRCCVLWVPQVLQLAALTFCETIFMCSLLWHSYLFRLFLYHCSRLHQDTYLLTWIRKAHATTVLVGGMTWWGFQSVCIYKIWCGSIGRQTHTSSILQGTAGKGKLL